MKSLCILLVSFISLIGYSQTDNLLIKKAERYEAAFNETAALETLRQVIKVNPNNYYAHWKASELCSRVGKRQSGREQQEAFYNAAKVYAAKAIKINARGADGYYAMALALGRLGLLQSGSERFHSVKEIKDNADKALKLNPKHARAWHVLGKWNYEVSNLSFIEKAGLKIIYGELPPASLARSIYAYEKAKLLEPDFALNYLALAKAYNRNNQTDKAMELLKKLPLLPNKTADDVRIKEEGAKLLRELSN